MNEKWKWNAIYIQYNNTTTQYLAQLWSHNKHTPRTQTHTYTHKKHCRTKERVLAAPALLSVTPQFVLGTGDHPTLPSPQFVHTGDSYTPLHTHDSPKPLSTLYSPEFNSAQADTHKQTCPSCLLFLTPLTSLLAVQLTLETTVSSTSSHSATALHSVTTQLSTQHNTKQFA